MKRVLKVMAVTCVGFALLASAVSADPTFLLQTNYMLMREPPIATDIRWASGVQVVALASEDVGEYLYINGSVRSSATLCLSNINWNQGFVEDAIACFVQVFHVNTVKWCRVQTVVHDCANRKYTVGGVAALGLSVHQGWTECQKPHCCN